MGQSDLGKNGHYENNFPSLFLARLVQFALDPSHSRVRILQLPRIRATANACPHTTRSSPICSGLLHEFGCPLSCPSNQAPMLNVQPLPWSYFCVRCSVVLCVWSTSFALASQTDDSSLVCPS